MAAILDECSSAITTHMEQRLYHLCIDNEITYITIAHRPALQAYHDNMLAIGDGKQGFQMQELLADAELMRATLAMAKVRTTPSWPRSWANCSFIYV